MQWIIIILATLGIFGLVYFLNKNKKMRFLGENKIIDRGNNDYFKQMHVFTTVTVSIADIGNALNKSVLSEEDISIAPDYEKSLIVFHQGGSDGSFAAALRTVGQDGESYIYRFQIESWTEKQGITRQDLLGANVLLTAIERAFLQLDRNTKVQSQQARYKTKSNNIFHHNENPN